MILSSFEQWTRSHRIVVKRRLCEGMQELLLTAEASDSLYLLRRHDLHRHRCCRRRCLCTATVLLVWELGTQHLKLFGSRVGRFSLLTLSHWRCGLWFCLLLVWTNHYSRTFWFFCIVLFGDKLLEWEREQGVWQLHFCSGLSWVGSWRVCAERRLPKFWHGLSFLVVTENIWISVRADCVPLSFDLHFIILTSIRSWFLGWTNKGLLLMHHCECV